VRAAGGSRQTFLHEQRLEAVHEIVRAIAPRTLLDLGCGDGALLTRLVGEACIERIVGIDLSKDALDRLRARLDEVADGRPATQVELIHGSMTDVGPDICGFDCAVLVETIEHIDPERLSVVERALFGQMRPKSVVVTTPNAEFNPLLGVPQGRFRHPGHRFEWDRAKFRRWAEGVAARNGYRVVCSDIAGGHPDLGGASQMAVFTGLTGQTRYGSSPEGIQVSLEARSMMPDTIAKRPSAPVSASTLRPPSIR
jgi:3' terminal RNA ribose 2'-O-methyltransferase Hen1